MADLANLRENYTAAQLLESDVAEHPVTQFESWFSQASYLPEPNAMTVASVNTEGQPSARIVLLKEFSNTGFIFYTNYTSRKATEILSTRKVALVFFWQELERQVRIEGLAQKTDTVTSDRYFASRPRKSQIGAHVSPQSNVLPNRNFLVQQQTLIENKYPEGTPIPRPENWGGILVVPEVFEFWQGRPGRLHDRIRYSQNSHNTWQYHRLAP